MLQHHTPRPIHHNRILQTLEDRVLERDFQRASELIIAALDPLGVVLGRKPSAPISRAAGDSTLHVRASKTEFGYQPSTPRLDAAVTCSQEKAVRIPSSFVRQRFAIDSLNGMNNSSLIASYRFWCEPDSPATTFFLCEEMKLAGATCTVQIKRESTKPTQYLKARYEGRWDGNPPSLRDLATPLIIGLRAHRFSS